MSEIEVNASNFEKNEKESAQTEQPNKDKRQRRLSYPIQYKKEVLRQLEHNNGNISATSRETGVKRSIIYGWIKQKEDIMKHVSDREENVRKIRKAVDSDSIIKNRGKYPDLEHKLYDWYKDIAKPQGIHVDMQFWQRKALEIFKETYPNEDENAFKASTGWLIRFLRRHKITSRPVTTVAQTIPLKGYEVLFNRDDVELKNSSGNTLSFEEIARLNSKSWAKITSDLLTNSFFGCGIKPDENPTNQHPIMKKYLDANSTVKLENCDETIAIIDDESDINDEEEIDDDNEDVVKS